MRASVRASRKALPQRKTGAAPPKKGAAQPKAAENANRTDSSEVENQPDEQEPLRIKPAQVEVDTSDERLLHDESQE